MLVDDSKACGPGQEHMGRQRKQRVGKVAELRS